MAVVTFQEAMDQVSTARNRHLLLGNGFSIALRPEIFTYGSLFGNADFTLAPHLRKVFSDLGTTDFEVVIRNLLNAARLVEIYEPGKSALIGRMRSDAEILKTILVNAIASKHPDRPYDISDGQYQGC